MGIIVLDKKLENGANMLAMGTMNQVQQGVAKDMSDASELVRA